MARSANQKKKLLVLYQLLFHRSDEEHPVTVQEMTQELARWDISAERKSIYADMEELREMGVDVQCRKGKQAGWYIGQRDFELAELKLLVDAVQSSRFLTAKKSDGLIAKLERLASVHEARQLQRQVYVDRRVKTMNESIFYNVDKLHAAIGAGRAITFRYFEYNMKKEKVFRREGSRYRVSPCGLIWDSENYYLAGWDGDNNEVRHYRVDKMSDITVTGQPRHVPEDWDPEGYARRHFGMFSGRQGVVRLRCAAHLAGVVLDRFGQDVILAPDGPDRFTVSLDVVVSPPFWGWVFGLGDEVEVLSPDWAAEEFRQRLAQVAARYEKSQD
jgi:predicted DNA-binding transcriptional regulator YafY